jgi:regulator of sigma E protease
MGGMDAGDFDEPNGFHSKSPWQRIAILAAGPGVNFLVAMLLITIAAMTQLNSEPGKVLGVVQGSPAAAAGIRSGDHIQTVDGKTITSFQNIEQAEVAAGGRPVVVTGTHADGQSFNLEVTPRCSGGTCQMGVGIAAITTPLMAMQIGLVFPWTALHEVILPSLGAVVTGQVQGGLFGKNGLTGPIGMAVIAAGAVNQGPPAYVTLLALLSVAVGVTNLLPLPALDGGQIFFAALEWLRRKPVDRDMELNFQRWGLAALLVLILVISLLDIQRLVTGQFPGVG